MRKRTRSREIVLQVLYQLEIRGNEVIDEGIVPGARIFIEALKWTKRFEVDGENFWKTDEDNVLAVDDST